LVTLTQIQEAPSKSLILLVGPPGSGKSTFCKQATLQNLADEKPVIYVTTKCVPSRIEEALEERGLGEIEPGLLSFVDAYNKTVGVSVSDRPDTVYADCNDLSSIDIAISKLGEQKERKHFLLVFDSLTSPYLFNGVEILRFMTHTLSSFAAKGNAVVVCIDEGCGKDEDVVAMMSLSDGAIKTQAKGDKRVFDVVKHPKLTPTRIEVPLEHQKTVLRFNVNDYDPRETGKLLIAMLRGHKASMRPEVGDYVNLFWPTLVHWSGMLWDLKRFPVMKYELNKEEESLAQDTIKFLPWHWKFFVKTYSKLFAPRKLNSVKGMKKAVTKFFGSLIKQERSGIVEYLEDISKTDEHYLRVYESVDCCGFENVGASMGLYLPSIIAGKLKGFGKEKIDWNAVETKCVGLGDPYCEFKLGPGEINELKSSLEKDSSVAERIRERVMNRLMEFFVDGSPLVMRPTLGSKVHFHVVWHVMGFPYEAGERYQVALRMGGAKAGSEVGEHMMDSGIEGDEAVKRVLHLLEHCKVGAVSMDKNIKIKENIESSYAWTMKTKPTEPSCYFTTGFLNGFFLAVKNERVREVKCMAMGDPYCEWEFR
jgi:predicted hydrocarbon binding protein/KaiC/GvpD/RAD55 family RecA-like ATPase